MRLSAKNDLRRLVIAVAMLVVLGYVYDKLSWTIPVNSDNASPVLEAYSIVHGNFLLHGWTTSADNYYTIDYFFYEVIGAVSGFGPALMHHAPAAIYAALVTMVLWVSQSRLAGVERYTAVMIPLIIVGMPAGLMADVSLLGPYHTATMLFMLVSFYEMDRCTKNTRIRDLLLVVLLLAFSVFGDPFSIWIGVVPMLLVLSTYLRQPNRVPLRQLAYLIGTVVLAMMVATIGARIFHGLGGMSFDPLNAAFVTLAALPGNIWLGIQGILGLFGLSFFGAPPASEQAVSGLWHATQLAFVCATVVGSLRYWRVRDQRMGFLERALLTSMVIDLLAYIFSNQPVNIWTSRYLAPIVVFGAVLAARTVAPAIARARWGAAGVTVYALISLVFFLPGLLVTPPPPPQAQLGAWLVAHNLHVGYAGYWNSNIVTVETGGDVAVRPVLFNGGKITPFLWNSSISWYGRPAHFVVYDSSNWGDVNLGTIEQTFGKPNRVAQVGSYYVAVWKRSITAALNT